MRTSLLKISLKRIHTCNGLVHSNCKQENCHPWSLIHQVILQIDINRPLIISGRSLGGSVASLFTLWLLDTIYLKTSRTPLCLTFGSPLLGDTALQQAISERPTWISCFLHVISNQDPVLRSLAKGYMPFGATLFISESGCACFENPKSVLELIKATSLGKLVDSQIIDYGSMLKKLKYNAIRQGKIEDMDTCDISDPVRSGITLQLLAIGAIEVIIFISILTAYCLSSSVTIW